MQPPTGGGAPEMVRDRRHLSMSQWMNSSVTDTTPAKSLGSLSKLSLKADMEHKRHCSDAFCGQIITKNGNDSKYPQCRFSGVSPENTKAANEETTQKI